MGGGATELALEVTVARPMDALRAVRCSAHLSLPSQDGTHPDPASLPLKLGSCCELHAGTSIAATTVRPVCTTSYVVTNSHTGGGGRSAQSHSGVDTFSKCQTALETVSALHGQLGVHRGVRVTDVVGCEDASEHALQDQEATHAEEFSKATEGNHLFECGSMYLGHNMNFCLRGTGVVLEKSGCRVRAHRPSPATRASVQLAADADASVSGGIKSCLADHLRYPFY